MGGYLSTWCCCYWVLCGGQVGIDVYILHCKYQVKSSPWFSIASAVAIAGHVHKYQTKFCISRKLKKSFLWITSVYLNFIQKETMVTQISAASSSPNFHSRKSYVKKITKFTFLAICANFPCKIEKFELENVGILGTGYCLQGSH